MAGRTAAAPASRRDVAADARWRPARRQLTGLSRAGLGRAWPGPDPARSVCGQHTEVIPGRVEVTPGRVVPRPAGTGRGFLRRPPAGSVTAMAATVQPPRGMRDFLPDDKSRREAVLAAIRGSFASYGYREIETPALEELSRLESGQGGENDKLIFRVQRRGLDPGVALLPGDSADLGLRFDLTLPLARFYATHRGELPEVFRAIQIAPVWRAERPQRGRYRQFHQCDIDVVGEPGPVAEVELIVATLDTLDALGVAGVSVRLNDRGVLFGLLDACGFASETHPAVLVVLDKLDKEGVEGVAAELAARGMPPGPSERLVRVVADLRAVEGDFDATFASLPGRAPDRAEGLLAIRDGVLEAKPDARLVADATLVRGQGYYTGSIFELHHPDLSASIGGGGRYDGMVGRFLGTDVPGCGFSIGFERVVELVDHARFGTRARRVALVYSSDVPPGRLVAWQRRLIGVGAEVRLVPRRRNLARQLEALVAEGFGEWAELDGSSRAPAAGGAAGLDLRDLR